MKFAYLKSFWNFEKTIEEIYQVKSNAFDILRFFLASLIIVFHSYVLTGSTQADILARFTLGQLNLGDFAVGGFFVISGFLITQSLLHSKNLIQYFWKRFLRLFPALFVSLIFCGILVGPLVTDLNVKEYFLGNQGVSPLTFILLNFSLNVFGYSYTIRDVFVNNPYPYIINGSLWTLKHEFASYLILAVISVFGFIRHPRLLLIFTGFIGGAYFANELVGLELFGKVTTTWWIFHSVEYPYFLKFFWMFLLGSVLYVYRKNIFISTKMIVLILGLLLGSIWLGYHHQAWFLFSPYIIISVAILLPLSSFSKYGDFSYGIYVYAFPVQQVIVYLLYPDIGAKRLMVYAFVPTLILAILSWKFIEKPALGLKNKLFVDRNPKS